MKVHCRWLVAGTRPATTLDECDKHYSPNAINTIPARPGICGFSVVAGLVPATIRRYWRDQWWAGNLRNLREKKGGQEICETCEICVGRQKQRGLSARAVRKKLGGSEHFIIRFINFASKREPRS